MDAAAFDWQRVPEQIRLSEIRGYLLNTLLRDCDWATMANQQELRVPFLGRRYMECVLGAPEQMTAAANGPKPRLSTLLSPSARRLAALPKRGFTMDYAGWLTGPLAAEFKAAAEALREMAGFEIDAGAQMAALRANRSQKEARRLWALLALGRYVEANGLKPQSGNEP
jgi:asparagine synthase (glutamine-hydrolysing)